MVQERNGRFDTLGRCKMHEWDWTEDRYTTARYVCIHCGRERGVRKDKVPEFEGFRDNGVCQVRRKRPRQRAGVQA